MTTIATVGRSLLVALLVWWSARFVPHPLDFGLINASFLHLVNLPFHEAGHLVFAPFGTFMTVLGGSLFQVIIPLVCAVAFIRREDWFGMSVCLWWAGQNFIDLAPYIADARALQMPLLGGQTGAEVTGHDWEAILETLGWLHLDHALGMAAHVTGSVIMVVSIAAAIWSIRYAAKDNAAMRTLFLLTVALAAGGPGFAQAPAQPATPRRAPAPAPVPPSRAGIAITVTDPHGTPIPGVHVDIVGGSDRNGDTDASGQINFVGMQPGTYRARFSGDTVTTFEREVTVRPGQPTVIDVALSPAPPPPAAPPPQPAATPAPAVGPRGMPQVLSIVDLAEKQLSGNQPRRETIVSCSGNTRTTLVLLNQDQPERLYEGAETEYYVVAGQGAVRLNGRDTALAAGSYVSLPRNTSHSIIRRGNRPLILLVTLSGEPCEDAK